MKKINRAFRLLIAVSITSFALSCNNNDTTEPAKDEAAAPADTATMKMAAPAAAAFTPFDALILTHNVKDYDKWRPFFNTDSTARRASGLTDLVVGREMDNANHIFIALGVSDVQKAKDFAANPRLKDVMDKGGVNSKPDAQFYHVIRFNAESKEKKWVSVTHKVKDFDAWVKVYDGEGKEKRAGEGMVDVVLARGIDDPNMVMLVFDITDMAKAKAAITSDEKKKLMMSAGVEGSPKIEFYNTVE